LCVTAKLAADVSVGSILLKNDFEEGLLATLIQDHARARNLDSRSPDTASFEDIRRFQLHVAASGVGVGVINRTASALRFFFRVTLGRYAIVEHTHFIHEPRKLPVVLSLEEVARLLKAAPGLKYKAALSVAYG